VQKVWTQKCKLLTFTQDLHVIYIRLLTLTCTTQVTTKVVRYVLKKLHQIKPLLGINPGIKVDNHDTLKFNLHIIRRAKKGCEFNQKRCELKIFIYIYIYISPIYIRVFLWRIKFTIWLATRKKKWRYKVSKGGFFFFFGKRKKGLRSPYFEGVKKGVELAIF
jgi:hypothetical protein